MDKKRFKITGEIQKLNSKNFTKKEKNKLLNEFIEFVENKGLLFFGITK